MKIRKNNVLPFPELAGQPGMSTIVAQIGSQRFAIHIQTEDLPPAEPPLVMPQRKATKAPSKIASSPGSQNANGNEIPSASYPSGTGLPVRRLAGVLVGRMEQA
jgi:hypothetical protein